MRLTGIDSSHLNWIAENGLELDCFPQQPDEYYVIADQVLNEIVLKHINWIIEKPNCFFEAKKKLQNILFFLIDMRWVYFKTPAIILLSKSSDIIEMLKTPSNPKAFFDNYADGFLKY